MDLVFDKVPILFDRDQRYPPIPNAHLEQLASWKRPRTVQKYAYQLRSFLQWCEDRGLDWATLRKESLWEFARSVRGGNNTFNEVMFRVRELYRFAELHHGLDNPMEFFGKPGDAVRRPRSRRPGIVLVSEGDAKRFIHGFGSPRDRLLATVYLLTGLRLSELLTLPRSFLGLRPSGGKVRYTVEGKGGVVRHLTMDSGLRDRIAAWAKGTGGPFIFTADSVRPLCRDTVEKAFRRNARKTGVKVHPHMLRHLYATRRLAELERIHRTSGGLNAALKVLQMELGHSSIETTSIYLHLASGEEASESLAEYQRKAVKDFDK